MLHDHRRCPNRPRCRRHRHRRCCRCPGLGRPCCLGRCRRRRCCRCRWHRCHRCRCPWRHRECQSPWHRRRDRWCRCRVSARWECVRYWQCRPPAPKARWRPDTGQGSMKAGVGVSWHVSWIRSACIGTLDAKVGAETATDGVLSHWSSRDCARPAWPRRAPGRRG
ncbi:hypothetical protein CXG53_13945 [Pseudomonas guariconensis]|uniref:Uncharacterized protein n=1 Tax=Pseudomonas guariconensis TaxID=1288410 RepID=A0AAX0VUR4_9PSED|nr:hypothetical protein CXG49_20160 [Pseudomonas guariconensis]PLV23580.1 hypothetical protein CXG53_13945 [Pseudomonas guariconensis]PLV28603.1 hypothetical protein CXG51_14415 [Pseudomonas guariconensis]